MTGGGTMASIRESVRESMRAGRRDFSLLAAAGVLALFGFAAAHTVFPNYHELQALEKRKSELQRQVDTAKGENARLKDEIEALDDPYYLAAEMVSRYRWRYPALPAPAPKDPATAKPGQPATQASPTPARRG